jgi:hypothetical protein
VVVDDLKKVDKDFVSMFPKMIDATPCDYFFGTSSDSLFFVTLDCEKRILYKSKWFDLKLKNIPSDMEVIKSSAEKEYVADYIEDRMRKRGALQV